MHGCIVRMWLLSGMTCNTHSEKKKSQVITHSCIIHMLMVKVNNTIYMYVRYMYSTCIRLIKTPQ